MQKHRQIRRLRYPNPMEDVPHQDSAKKYGNKLKLYFAYPSKTGKGPIHTAKTKNTRQFQNQFPYPAKSELASHAADMCEPVPINVL